MISWVFGHHAVMAVLNYQPSRAKRLWVQENIGSAELLQLAKILRIPTTITSKLLLKEKLGPEAVHQGLALEVGDFIYADFQEALEKKPNLCVVLDQIEDPRNFGRAARAAFAFGAELLVIPKDRAATVSSVAEKASVGAFSRIPVARVTNLNRALQDLKEAGLWIIGTRDRASMPLWKCDLTKPVALVIGNEESGLRQQVLENCDEIISIPMEASDMSLNAADATAVTLYEVRRQRYTEFNKLK